MYEASLSVNEPNLVLSLFGAYDEHLRTIRENLGVAITHREGEIRVSGNEGAVAQATKALEDLKGMVVRKGSVSADDVSSVLARVTGGDAPLSDHMIDVIQPGISIKPRTKGQAAYIAAIRQHDLVFALGPAGTGKTFLAVATAVEALKQQEIRKIVLVRPAVEAGESLGYLPGDLQAKINPYLRPLLDALHEMIDYDQIKRLMEQDVIEVIPLAYMRGRTLNDAFIILDEGQNTTTAQMKMFLTRMGEGSKIVVSGDTTQVDLPTSTRSGLTDAVNRLRSISKIAVVKMTNKDIVRNRLVQDIVRAYDESPRRFPPKAFKAEGRSTD